MTCINISELFTTAAGSEVLIEPIEKPESTSGKAERVDERFYRALFAASSADQE